MGQCEPLPQGIVGGAIVDSQILVESSEDGINLLERPRFSIDLRAVDLLQQKSRIDWWCKIMLGNISSRDRPNS